MNGKKKMNITDAPAIDESEGGHHKLEQNEREVREKLLYLRAELENFRRAADRENAALRRAGEEALLRQLIPVAGLLSSAILVARQEKDEGMALGLEMISRQLQAVFQKFGMSMTKNSGHPIDLTLDQWQEGSDG